MERGGVRGTWGMCPIAKNLARLARGSWRCAYYSGGVSTPRDRRGFRRGASCPPKSVRSPGRQPRRRPSRRRNPGPSRRRGRRRHGVRFVAAACAKAACRRAVWRGGARARGGRGAARRRSAASATPSVGGRLGRPTPARPGRRRRCGARGASKGSQGPPRWALWATRCRARHHGARRATAWICGLPPRRKDFQFDQSEISILQSLEVPGDRAA